VIGRRSNVTRSHSGESVRRSNVMRSRSGAIDLRAKNRIGRSGRRIAGATGHPAIVHPAIDRQAIVRRVIVRRAIVRRSRAATKVDEDVTGGRAATTRIRATASRCRAT